MDQNGDLIDRIYEASVVVERWPYVLQDIADRVGARGAAFMMRSPAVESSIASPAIVDDLNDFMSQGWGSEIEFVAPLLAEHWPGFRIETDYRTPAEIAALPVHAEFLDPRGYISGAATIIQGAGHHLIHAAFEGFQSHGAARGAVSYLDELRPHLARSISLTALHTDRSQVVVDSLAIGGVAAAVIGGQGRLKSANEAFIRQMGDRMASGVRGLRFADRRLATQVAAALERHLDGVGYVQSVAMQGSDGAPPFAMHLLPITGAAREMCDSDGVLLLIAETANASVPSADLLRLLFDLTPMEARVARNLLEGGSVASAAAALGIGTGTVRSHLKSVFAKTQVSRQSELVRLLSTFGPPISNVSK